MRRVGWFKGIGRLGSTVGESPQQSLLSRCGWCMRYSVRMGRRYLLLGWFVACILLVGCTSQRIIPESMEPLVDRTVSFHDVLASPESYKGRVLVLGV